MGREKRKGKEIVVEKPVRKQTHAEREAERAEMVAKAAEEQRQAVLVRSGSGSSQLEPEAREETEGAGPSGPRLRQLQGQIAQIQMQRSQSSLRGRVLRGHRLHDVLAALGKRPQQETLGQRPSVALDRGHEEVTSYRCLAGPQLQLQQLAEPRP